MALVPPAQSRAGATFAERVSRARPQVLPRCSTGEPLIPPHLSSVTVRILGARTARGGPGRCCSAKRWVSGACSQLQGSPTKVVDRDGACVPGLLASPLCADETGVAEDVQVMGRGGGTDPESGGNIDGARWDAQVIKNARASRADESGRGSGGGVIGGSGAGVPSGVVDRGGPRQLGGDRTVGPTEEGGNQAQPAAAAVRRQSKSTVCAEDPAFTPGQAGIEVFNDSLKAFPREEMSPGSDVSLEDLTNAGPMRSHPLGPEEVPCIRDLCAGVLGILEPAVGEVSTITVCPPQLGIDNLQRCGASGCEEISRSGRFGLDKKIGGVPACPGERGQDLQRCGGYVPTESVDQRSVQWRGFARSQPADGARTLVAGRDGKSGSDEFGRSQDESIGPHDVTVAMNGSMLFEVMC